MKKALVILAVLTATVSQAQTAMNVVGKNSWLFCSPYITVEQFDFDGAKISETSASSTGSVITPFSLLSNTWTLTVRINRSEKEGQLCGEFSFIKTSDGWECTNKNVTSVFIMTQNELEKIYSKSLVEQIDFFN